MKNPIKRVAESEAAKKLKNGLHTAGETLNNMDKGYFEGAVTVLATEAAVQSARNHHPIAAIPFALLAAIRLGTNISKGNKARKAAGPEAAI